MKIIQCEQGSDAWRMARCGVATASQIHRLVTPARLQPSAQLRGYALELCAEWLLCRPLDDGAQSPWMDRGVEIEAEARAWLALEAGEDVEEVGFILMDDGFFGCSPDGVGDGFGVEIKCPNAVTHLSYLLSDGIPPEHLGQIQGGLHATGWDRWAFVSYCPGLPGLLRWVHRDERYQDAIADALERLLLAVNEAKWKVRELGALTADERADAARAAENARLDAKWKEIVG